MCYHLELIVGCEFVLAQTGFLDTSSGILDTTAPDIQIMDTMGNGYCENNQIP